MSSHTTNLRMRIVDADLCMSRYGSFDVASIALAAFMYMLKAHAICQRYDKTHMGTNQMTMTYQHQHEA